MRADRAAPRPLSKAPPPPPSARSAAPRPPVRKAGVSAAPPLPALPALPNSPEPPPALPSVPQPPVAASAPPAVPIEPTHLAPAAQVPLPPPVAFTVGELEARQLAEGGEQRAEQARELVRHCENELQRHPQPERAARLHYEMARAYEAALGESERASEHYDAALALSVTHVPSIQGARRMHLLGKRYAKAVTLFDAELKLTAEGSNRALLLYEKGCLLQDRLGQRSEARDAFAQAAELSPGDPTVLKALQRVEQQLSAWANLDRALELEIHSVVEGTEHRAALMAERARLAESQRGVPELARELYETALATDPQAAGAVPALKALLRGQTRWRELCDVLRQESRLSADGAVRAMQLYRVARIQSDHLGDLEQAILALEAANKELPQDATIEAELARLYEAAQRWTELASTQRKLAELTADAPSRVAALHQVGQLYEERLNDDQQAIACYNAALQLQPAFSPTLQALGRLYARRGSWEALVAMHLHEVKACDDVERRAATLHRVAEVYENQLRRSNMAVTHHLLALEQEPGFAPAFKALVRLYTEAGKWRELCELYEREVDRVDDAEAKITSLFKIGRIQEDALNDFSAALATFKRVLQVQPRHFGALHAIQRVAERAGAHRELVEALRLEASYAKDSEKRLLHLAAEVLEQRVGDAEAAIVCYREVLELDEAYAPALASLGRLYFRLGRHEDLLSVYRMELRTLRESGARAALCYKMGELCEHLLADSDAALGCYRQAVESDADHSAALAALLRLLGASGKWAEVARLTEAEAQRVQDTSTQALLAFRLGEIYEDRLAQPARALASYRRALSLLPGHRLALEAQARLLEATGDFDALASALMQQSEQGDDRALSLSAAYRAATLYRDRLKRPAEAVSALEGIVEREPSHVGALLALEQLYADQAQWQKLADVYQRQALVLDTKAAQLAALRARCRVLEAHGTSEELQAACQELLSKREDDPIALSLLERLALAQGDALALASVDRVRAGREGSEPTLAAHRTRLGEALLASGNAAALDMFRSALSLDPENMAAARGLSRMAQARQEPALLRLAARAELDTLRDAKRAAQLFTQSAQLQQAQHEFDAATTDLEQALEADPDCLEATTQLQRLLQAAPARLIGVLTKAAGASARAERRCELWCAIARVQEQALQDRGAAISAVERAVKEQPRNTDALVELARLYGDSAQWQPAAERLKQLLALDAPPELRRSAHLRLAEVALQHLNNPVLALSQVRAVLASDAHNVRALRLLVDIELGRGQLESAAAASKQLLELDLPEVDRSLVLWDAARVEKARGRQEQFAELAQQAIATVGLQGEAAAGYRGWLEGRRSAGQKVDWSGYVAALSQFCERGDISAAQRAQALLELGRVHGDEMGQHERSLGYLSKGLRLAPHDTSLIELQARQLERAGQVEEAARAYLNLLGHEPRRDELWRHLHELYRGAGRTEQARLALAPLVGRGVASETEVMSYRMRAAHSPEPRRPLDEAWWVSVGAGEGSDAQVTALMSALQPALHKVFPANLARYGRDALERLTARSSHPLRLLAGRIAELVGVGSFDLYLYESNAVTVSVEFNDTPALMAPLHVTSLTEAEQAFLLARPLAAAARGLLAVERLSHGELGLLWEAALAAGGSARAASHDPEAVAELAKVIARAIPRRQRRAFEESATACAAMSAVDLAGWAHRMRAIHARAALLIGDDCAGALSLLEARRVQSQGATEQELAILQSDLARFALSDTAATLRHRLQG